MLSTVKSYLTKPSTYVLIGVGIVLAFAYGSFLGKWAKPVASALPKSEAK